MGVLSGIGRVILVILNIIFLIISLALMAVGGILKFTPGTIMTFLSAGIDTLIPQDVGDVKVPKTMSFVPMIGDVGIALLVGGVILFVLSFLACCGACCRWRPFLIVFVIVMTVLIVCISTVGGLFLVPDSILHQNIKDRLSNKVVTEYEDDKNGVFSTIMNVLHVKMHCCGFEGPGSYAVDWKNNLQVVPMSCASSLTKASYMDWQRGTTSDDDFYYPNGCYEKLTDYIVEYKTYSIIALVGIVVLLLLEVVFAVIIIMQIGQDRKTGPV